MTTSRRALLLGASAIALTAASNTAIAWRDRGDPYRYFGGSGGGWGGSGR